MKIIIPAKKNSTRVPSKNWRSFDGNKNLVEIKIEQVLKAAAPGNVFLSTDDAEKENLAKQY
jgi:CMP-N-acetylneuraminic acid synthetase